MNSRGKLILNLALQKYENNSSVVSTESKREDSNLKKICNTTPETSATQQEINTGK